MFFVFSVVVLAEFLKCRIFFYLSQSVCGHFLASLVICLAGKFDEVYSKLVDANPNMVVFKKEDIPKHFHYQHNIRIMPILIEAKEGWTVVQNRTRPFMCT